MSEMNPGPAEDERTPAARKGDQAAGEDRPAARGGDHAEPRGEHQPSPQEENHPTPREKDRPAAPRVRRLDPRVVAKIAAGEMILRPFSVAKELIENSLDAGARRIEVSLGESPDQSIEVADDGCGMSREDLVIALEPHATSKLEAEEDLLRVTSLGFRGEALPSIGRVSRMEILTAGETNGEGTRVVVAGGDCRVLEPTARPRGTTVRVADLFYNSPVRKRFLKSPESEVRLVVKLVATCALAFPEVSFFLRSRGAPLLELPAVDGLAGRIVQLHGPSFADKVLALGDSSPTAGISGFIGIPELARPGTQHQTFLVNKRWVTAPWFSAALRQGFGDLLPGNRNPFAIILLSCDPARIDVNVHPTKREVHFLDETALFGAVVRAVKASTIELVPGWNLDPKDPGSGRPWDQMGLARTGAAEGSGRVEGGAPGTWHGHRGGGSGGLPGILGDHRYLPGPRAFDLLYDPLRTDRAGAGIAGEGAERAAGAGIVGERAEGAAGESAFPQIENASAVGAAGGPAPADAGAGSAHADTEAALDSAQAADAALRARGGLSPADAGTALAAAHSEGALVPLWQLHRRYLFAPTRQGFLIIDQHAAHERILYEQALENLRGAAAATQQLLFPLPLALDLDEWAAFREFSADLESLGIDAEEFGQQTVLLRGTPIFWDQDPEGRLRELLHELATNRNRSPRRNERLAAGFACRSAIRSGQALSLEEMNALVDQLFATRVPHGDPHGRPTFLQVSLADLDRRFGRTG